MDYVNDRFKLDIKDNDIGDAIGIGAYALDKKIIWWYHIDMNEFVLHSSNHRRYVEGREYCHYEEEALGTS